MPSFCLSSNFISHHFLAATSIFEHDYWPNLNSLAFSFKLVLAIFYIRVMTTLIFSIRTRPIAQAAPSPSLSTFLHVLQVQLSYYFTGMPSLTTPGGWLASPPVFTHGPCTSCLNVLVT